MSLCAAWNATRNLKRARLREKVNEVNAMDFDEMFRKFFLNYAQGKLSVRNSTDEVQPLRHDDPNVWELAQHAIEFRCEEKWHSREAFVNLMRKRMQPGQVFQIA